MLQMLEVTNVRSCKCWELRMSEFSLRDRSVEVKSEARVDNILSGQKIFHWGRKIFRQVRRFVVGSGITPSGRKIFCKVGKYSVKSEVLQVE